MKTLVSNSSSSKTFQQPTQEDIERLDRKADAAATAPKGASVTKKR